MGAGSGSKESSILPGKVRKGLKVVGKSPYLNNVFTKGANPNQSQTQNTGESSASSSSKANRNGAASADISESSLIVIKKATQSSVQGAIQTINSSSVKPVDKKLLERI